MIDSHGTQFYRRLRNRTNLSDWNITPANYDSFTFLHAIEIAG